MLRFSGISLSLLLATSAMAGTDSYVGTTARNIKNSPISFAAGVANGVLGGGLQRLITYETVNRNKDGWLKIFNSDNSQSGETADDNYENFRMSYWGSHAGAFAGGFAADTAINHIFRRYGTDFWSNLIPDADKSALQQGFNYGKGLLAAGIATGAWVKGNSRIPNQILFNEFGTIASAATNLRMEQNLSGGMSLRYNLLNDENNNNRA